MAERVFPTVGKQLAGRKLVRRGIALAMHLAVHDAFKNMDDLGNPMLSLVPLFLDDWVEAILEVSASV